MNYCDSTHLWQQWQHCANEIVHLLRLEKKGFPTEEKELEQQTAGNKKKNFIYITPATAH